MPAPYNLTDNPNPNGKHPGGCPLKWQSVEVMQIAIDKYFEDCDKGKEKKVYDKKEETVKTVTETIPYTITGLALALGTTRQGLIDYAERGEFSDAIKRAKLRCENYVEKLALSANSGVHPSGPIFCLKNYGWTDRQTIDVTDNRMVQAILESLPDAVRDQVEQRLVERAKELKLVTAGK